VSLGPSSAILDRSQEMCPPVRQRLARILPWPGQRLIGLEPYFSGGVCASSAFLFHGAWAGFRRGRSCSAF